MGWIPQPKDNDWLNGYKNKTPIYAVYKTPPQKKRHIQTESEGLGKYISHKWRLRKKKAEVAMLISDKIDVKIMAMKRDKEGHYIMIKRWIQEEDITIVNIYMRPT